MCEWNEGEPQNKINVSLTFRFINWVLLGCLFWLCGQYLILNLVGYVEKTRIFPYDFDHCKNVYIRTLRWGKWEEVDWIWLRKMCSKNVKSKFLCLVKHHTKKVRGGLELQFPEVFTSTLYGSEWSADSRPNTRGERAPSAYKAEGRVDPSDGLDALENREFSFCRESNQNFLVFQPLT